MNISDIDFKAIELNDSNLFLNKGANLYNEGKYNEAMEYYEIAAAMNNSHAISNLGYCYLYGRGIPKDEKKALLYFNIAARKNDIDALYKLGTLYLSGTIVEKDNDLALYYLEKAKYNAIKEYGDLVNYPSLCYTLAREYMKNIEKYRYEEIYELLEDARYGFEYEIEERGATYYKNNYMEVLKMLKNPMFDEFRD